jgi:hypothetical protein
MTEQQFDVFISHNSKDKPWIRQLYAKLKARNIHPWFDETEISPGARHWFPNG